MWGHPVSALCRYVYLVDYAERDLNLELSDATFLISFIGILNTVGELIIGWVGDRAWANFNVIYAVCIAIQRISDIMTIGL